MIEVLVHLGRMNRSLETMREMQVKLLVGVHAKQNETPRKEAGTQSVL